MAKTKLHWSTYLLILVGIGLAVYAIILALKPSDFTVYYKAAELMRAGDSPYDKWLFVKEGNYCLYFYSPFWAFLLIPFTFLPPVVSALIWLWASVYFLYRIGVLLKGYLVDFELTNKQYRLLFFLVIAGSVRFILSNFEMVQMTIFLVWGALEALHLLEKGRLLTGSALLALVINIKLLPLVILPYLLYRRQFKATAAVIGFLIVYLCVPMIVFGWEINLNWVTDWFHTLMTADKELSFETDLGPHSLTALVPILLTPTVGDLALQRHVFALSKEQVILVLNVIRLGLVVLTLYFLKGRPFKPAESRLQELYALSYLFLLIPLIFPHQQKYAFFCCVPVLFYLAFYLIYTHTNQRKSKMRWQLVLILAGLSFVLMTLTTDGLVGRELNAVFQHYKVLTYGALFLIPALMVAKPPRTRD